MRKYFLDLLQRNVKLPEKQNLLQSLQRFIVIKPVSRFRSGSRRKKPDLVIIVKRAYADTCKS